ncbi:MAG TPA: TlpA disulfide reductase family protein [Acidimicrobiia bacterium]|nr:TlpA disulfide reductase family protein [Acidimicrobiia bacterium]
MVHRLTAIFTGFLVVVLAVLMIAGCASTATAPSTTTGGTVTTVAQGEEPGEATTTTRVTPEGDPAPDFTLALDGGGSFSLSDETKPVLLVFWAEWCPNCSVEMPIVNSLAADYGDDVTFVAVAGRSTLEASQARAAVWFPSDRILWGYDDDLWQTYLVRGQPVGFFISSDNVIVDQWFGNIGKEAIMERLDTLLAIG